MLRHNKISPKKPCPFCGAFLENEAPSTIWCHPRNSCLLVDDKEDIVSAIATDPEATSEIKPHLVKAGYSFEEREAFWKNTYQNIFPDKN